MYKTNRQRTRDLLLRFNELILPIILSEDPKIPHIYPWEISNLTLLSDKLYTLALHSGYMGTKEEFTSSFGKYLDNKTEIIFETYANFPEIGEADKLYFDTEEHILYYWENEYIPISANLIDDTIFNGGTNI